jgi:hypothetical protein
VDNNGTRFTLRNLPLPAKLVVTVFLFSVGLGYCWAVMQLHFKHADRGEMIPGVRAVVARFSGVNPPWEKEEAGAEAKPEEKQGGVRVEPKGGDRRDTRIDRKPEPEPKKAAPKMVAGAKIKSIINDRCVACHAPDEEKKDVPFTSYDEIAKVLDPSLEKNALHKAIKTDNEENWTKESMAQAFTKKSFEEFEIDGKKDSLEWKDQIKQRPEAELRAERDVERLAIKLWVEAGAPREAYEKDAFPLPEGMGSKITKRFQTTAPEHPKAVDTAGGNGKKRKNPKDCQLSVEALTQSTHAHLLSFSMLWALTGIIFAFTSYPLWIRVGLSPIVLVFQIVDIAFWWLARLPDVGPYFAVGIMGTGAIVGLGLVLQILLSLFNMYGCKGKFVLLLLLVAGGAGGGLVYTKYIQPQVAEETKG